MLGFVGTHQRRHEVRAPTVALLDRLVDTVDEEKRHAELAEKEAELREEIEAIRKDIDLRDLRPTKMFVPALMVEQALKLLDNEFDKQYAMTTRRIL